ncbi:MAG TPA: hypothetical protein VF532_00795 [Candidatus Angelobacter sp.]
MTDTQGNGKLSTYRALYRLNRAFAHVDHNLETLLGAKVVDDEYMRAWQDQLAEVRAEINRRLTENLHNMEHGDVMRLGRIVAMAPQVRALYATGERPARKKPGRKSTRRG